MKKMFSALGLIAVSLGIGLAQTRFSDNFNRATIGNSWNVRYGNWRIESNMLKHVGDGTFNPNFLLCANPITDSVFTAQCKVRWASGGFFEDGISVFHRPLDASLPGHQGKHDEYFLGLLSSYAGDDARLYRSRVRQSELLDHTISYPRVDSAITTNRWFNLKMVAEKTSSVRGRVRLYVNEKLYLYEEGHLDSLLGNRVGLGSWKGQYGQVVYFDDFIVYGPSGPDIGLVAYYPFNGNANDESGNAIHGVVYGASLVADRSGNPNRAYHFNGTTDSIACGNNSILQSANVSIACWIKPDVMPIVNSPTIVTKSVKGRDGWTLQVYNTNRILCEGSRSGAWAGLYNRTPLIGGQWYFVAMTYDSATQQVRSYVAPNGAPLVDTVTTFRIDKALTRNMTIGNGYNTLGSDGTKGFQGTIDDLRIYNRVLSQSEIEGLITNVGGAYKELPSSPRLLQNYPNPFNPTTTIEYQLPSRGTVQVNIYNSLGQLVRTLVNEQRDAGTHSVVWGGRDNDGNAVSTGAYFYQVKVGEFVQAKRMLLLK